MRALFKKYWLIGQRKLATYCRRRRAWHDLELATEILESILNRMQSYHTLESWTSRAWKDISNESVFKCAAIQLFKVREAEKQCRRVGIKENKLVAMKERRVQHWNLMVDMVQLSRALNTAGL